jgi:hypothetical protein
MINPDALRNQRACACLKDPLRFERDLPIENMRGLLTGIHQVWWTTPVR